MITDAISFFVPGHAKTAGSKRAFMRPGMKYPVIVEDCKGSNDWRGDVKRFAVDAKVKAGLDHSFFEGPIAVSMTFTMERPLAHYRGSDLVTLKANADQWHWKRPDVLKLARAVEDALTGILWRDDSQIACEHLEKEYGAEIGCLVEVKQLPRHPQSGAQIRTRTLGTEIRPSRRRCE